jgi:hypothetical protein
MKDKKTPSSLALQTAAKVWGMPTTAHKDMDAELATAFAEVIDDIWSKPWLGNATTKELLDEIGARCGDLNYRTVDN